jgi:hypothetical protein
MTPCLGVGTGSCVVLRLDFAKQAEGESIGHELVVVIIFTVPESDPGLPRGVVLHLDLAGIEVSTVGGTVIEVTGRGTAIGVTGRGDCHRGVPDRHWHTLAYIQLERNFVA